MLNFHSSRVALICGIFIVGSLLLACSSNVEPEEIQATVGPQLIVLGTAQDGGLPHVSCSCRRCLQATHDPAARRRVSSVLIETTDPPRRYLIDATPDLPEQLALLRPRSEAGRVDRRPLDGILLTHAHMGHYLGLAYLGFEAMHSPGIPVYCTERFAAFLRNNGPWDQLVRLGNILIEPAAPEWELEGGIRIRVIPVPHRDEYSDTVAFLIEGPNTRILYAPDTDGWQKWEPSIESWLSQVDIAILDGTFFSLAEMPGREVTAVGHPLIADSIDRFTTIDDGGAEIYFTHFNHSNPILQTGLELERVRAAGFHRLEEQTRFPL